MHVDERRAVGELSVELQQEVEIARAVSSPVAAADPRRGHQLALGGRDAAAARGRRAAALARRRGADDLAPHARALRRREHGDRAARRVPRRRRAAAGHAGERAGAPDGRARAGRLLPQARDRARRDGAGGRGTALARRPAQADDAERPPRRDRRRRRTGRLGQGRARSGARRGDPERGQRARAAAGPPTSRSRAPRLRAGSASCPTTASGPRCCRRAAWPRTSPSRGRASSRAPACWTRARSAGACARRSSATTSSPRRRRAASRRSRAATSRRSSSGACFARDLEVLVLSEPTRGIDVGAKSEIYRLMQEHAAQGAAIIVISSELPELLGIADRILVFFRGEVRGEFAAAGTGGGGGRPRGGLRRAPGACGLTMRTLRRRPRWLLVRCRGLRLPLAHRRRCS